MCFYARGFVASREKFKFELITISSLEAALTGSSFSSTISTLSSWASLDSRFIVDLCLFENAVPNRVPLNFRNI
jgi:hypothetical protein